MKKTLLLAGVAGTLFTLNANAMDLKPYVGLDYSYVKASTNNIVVEDVLVSSEFYEDSFHSAVVNAGIKLHKNVGLEAFYQKSSKEDGKLASLNIGGTTVGTDKLETSFDAYGLDLQGYLPLNENIELIGSAGLGQYKFKMKGFGYTAKDDETGYRLGLGTQYNINEHFALRGMIRYNIIDSDAVDDIKEFSLGIRYNF